MRIDVITKPEELQDLRQNWDRLYEQDPDAHFFVSWTFLSTYVRRFDGVWFILAARLGSPGSPYVALLPLRLRTKVNGKTGHCFNEINMGGAYAADYTGLICAPGYAERAIAAFAKHLKRMHWTRLHLENLRMSDKRLRLLYKHMADDRLGIRELKRINKKDNTDNCKCPSVGLPDTWDLYLEQKLGSNTRQKVRRFLRKVEDSKEYRITVADASTIKRDIEILLDFWRVKWTVRKGDLVPGLVKSNRRMFWDGYKSGTLFLPVLWQGEKPIGALATFLDPVKKTMLFLMAGRDETFDALPSGLVLHGYSIRYGIERGFRTYDFLRGNEPYKYTFGAKDTVIKCSLVYTRNGKNLGDRLDATSLASVFLHASRFHKERRLPQAERGYREVLKADPDHAHALYALGQLLAGRSDHREAAKCFRRLCSVAPASAKAWARLGAALQALDLHPEACDAFRKAVEHNPGFAAAHYGLGASLLQLDRLQEAREAFTEMLQHRSSVDRREDALRIKAGLLLRKLNETGLPRQLMRNTAKAAAPVLEHSAT